MDFMPPVILVDEWGSAYMIDRESDEMVQIPISNEGWNGCCPNWNDPWSRKKEVGTDFIFFKICTET